MHGTQGQLEFNERRQIGRVAEAHAYDVLRRRNHQVVDIAGPAGMEHTMPDGTLVRGPHTVLNGRSIALPDAFVYGPRFMFYLETKQRFLRSPRMGEWRVACSSAAFEDYLFLSLSTSLPVWLLFFVAPHGSSVAASRGSQPCPHGAYAATVKHLRNRWSRLHARNGTELREWSLPEAFRDVSAIFGPAPEFSRFPR